MQSTSRALSRADHWLSAVENGLRTLSGSGTAGRPRPVPETEAVPLNEDERRRSGALMRVNHVGEVCAQALYQAQALSTRDAGLRQQFLAAADEETDHLAWSAERLQELQARPSWLNPLWYAGAFGLGLLAGRTGDRFSLGFLAETERQVERHLDGHLDRLPVQDHASRAIVAQMASDEARHGAQARLAGGTRLPAPVRWAMRGAAKVMTTTAYYI
jgi:ubiquinone biosynthesis monooxygenase Coq7